MHSEGPCAPFAHMCWARWDANHCRVSSSCALGALSGASCVWAVGYAWFLHRLLCGPGLFNPNSHFPIDVVWCKRQSTNPPGNPPGDPPGENLYSKLAACIHRIVSLAERSKALRSGRSLFGGVGSNPTGDTFSNFHILEQSFYDVSLALVHTSTYRDGMTLYVLVQGSNVCTLVHTGMECMY